MFKTRVKCDYDGCEKSYCSLFNLKRHTESSHMGIKKFKCPTCHRFLSSKQNYIDHQNIHTTAKPYVCQVPGCTKTYRQLSQFYIHQKSHSLPPPGSPQTPSPTSDIILSLLTSKLSKLSLVNYNIQLLPYTQDSVFLPAILQCPSEVQSSIQLPKPSFSSII